MSRPIRSQLWLQIAVVYFVLAVALGLAMGAAGDFTLMPVHVQLNLLGWIAMSLIGLATARFPQLGYGRLAVAQFWLYNLGVPVMLLALAAGIHGRTGAEHVATAASAIVALSLGMLACQVGLCMRQSRLAHVRHGWHRACGP
ncbi:MAG TPA: hypothetical protein VFR20_10385 [Burkholderiaceae bacterium]|nr:hypothetical protein [Burkholderiaceae bacterium]